MPRLLNAVVLLAALALAGCCRDTIREMGSLKDVGVHPKARAAKVSRESRAAGPDRTERAAKVEKDDDDDDEIETGSIAQPTCQGQHLAYQATKEYLKNFGPKPPDQPGEVGPCKPAQ
jgi:predicted small secreted protein